MHFLVVCTAVPGLVLIFLAAKTRGFRLVAGVSSLFSSAYMYGINEPSPFIDSLGMLGFVCWLGSLLGLLMSLVVELTIKDASMKPLTISCLVASSASNAVFAFMFARAAGLGIV